MLTLARVLVWLLALVILTAVLLYVETHGFHFPVSFRLFLLVIVTIPCFFYSPTRIVRILLEARNKLFSKWLKQTAK